MDVRNTQRVQVYICAQLMCVKTFEQRLGVGKEISVTNILRKGSHSRGSGLCEHQR